MSPFNFNVDFPQIVELAQEDSEYEALVSRHLHSQQKYRMDPFDSDGVNFFGSPFCKDGIFMA